MLIKEDYAVKFKYIIHLINKYKGVKMLGARLEEFMWGEPFQFKWIPNALSLITTLGICAGALATSAIIFNGGKLYNEYKISKNLNEMKAEYRMSNEELAKFKEEVYNNAKLTGDQKNIINAAATQVMMYNAARPLTVMH